MVGESSINFLADSCASLPLCIDVAWGCDKTRELFMITLHGFLLVSLVGKKPRQQHIAGDGESTGGKAQRFQLCENRGQHVVEPRKGFVIWKRHWVL